MSENQDLLSYLQEQACDGSKESEGEFTISLETARKKLAKFSLPRTNAWASKLVQAAVGWGMKSIQLSQSWMETEFFFEPPEAMDLVSEKELLSALISGQVFAETPLAQFCLALRALVEQANLSFLLVVNDGKSLPKPLYAGAYYSRQSEDKRLARCHTKPIGLTLVVRHAYSLNSDTPVPQLVGLRSNGLPVFEELENHAYLSPVPLIHKKRRLNELMDSPYFRFAWQQPLALSGLKDLVHSPQELQLPDSFEEKQLSFLTSSYRARRRYGGGKQFSCAYSISALSRGAPPKFTTKLSSLNWIRDGVVVQMAILPIETAIVGLQIYANAQGLKSDLTGFQLVEDADRTQREHEIYSELSAAIFRWIPMLDGFFRVDRDPQSAEDDRLELRDKIKGRGSVLAAISGMGLLWSLAAPMVGIPSTLVGVAATVMRKTEAQKAVVRKEKVRLVLQKDLERISDGLAELAEELSLPASS
jgi:hypothetical protein